MARGRGRTWLGAAAGLARIALIIAEIRRQLNALVLTRAATASAHPALVDLAPNNPKHEPAEPTTSADRRSDVGVLEWRSPPSPHTDP